MNAAVFLAARNGDLDAIKKLHGQNPRQLKEVSFEGNTVLHIAAKEGHLELVQWILQNVKGLARARNADRNTPLHAAAKRGNGEIITALLRYNKCPAAKRNQFGESALLIASEHGHVDAVRVLVKATPFYLIIWPRNDHQTCLHVAAYGGHFEVAKLIIERKSFCNILHFILLITDVYGATPLHCAIHGEDPRIITEILNVPLIPWHIFCFDKSIMTKKDNFGRCAVHVAAMKGRWDIIEIFISRMPDCVEIRSSDLKTTLHFAVESNQFEVVQKLLFYYKPEEVAKLVSYDRDISGNTTLHLATINQVDPQLVEYLVSFPNVNVNAINSDGKSAVDIALDIVTSDNQPRCDKIKSILEDVGASESCINNSKPQKSIGSEQGNGEEGKIMDVDTLVASLIASITFAVIFAIPGGVTSGFKNKGENEVASLGLNTLFQVFLFSDSLALFSSLTVIISWLFHERLHVSHRENRSLLANFSVLSLGTSIASTALAFLSATILVTVPLNYENLKHKDQKHFKKYQLLLGGEIFTAFIVPTLALLFLSMLWVVEYYFKATIEHQAHLKKQLKQVVIYIIPSFSIIFGIIVCYGVV